jgi:hypothetical protein
MNYRFLRRAIGLAVITATAACSGTPTTPSPTFVPTLAPLLIPRVAGLWGGTMTLNPVTGGTGVVPSAGLLDCVGDTFNRVIGQANEVTLEITQDGRALEAKLRSSSTGLACTYTGTVGVEGTIALDAVSCGEPADQLIVACVDNDGTGGVRTMDFVGSTLTASVAPSVNDTVNVTAIVNGTAAYTYNLPGEGGFVANQSFTLVRR